MMKKLLSVLLVAAMLLSVLPMGIFAEDTDGAAYAGEETSLISISADGRTATASASGDELVLTAIYDRGGKRMIAYAKGEEVTLPDDVAGDGECVARAFLLEEDTLIPVCKYAEVNMGVLKKAEETTEPSEPEETKPGNNITAEMKNGSLWVGGSGTLDGSVNWPKDIDLTAVTSIVVDPNASFETLEAGAFDSFTNLITLDIGGVKNIGESAFVANTRLTQVTIRTGKLESIGDGAFALESLGGNTVSFEGTKAQWDAIGAPVGAFLETTTIRMTDSTDKGTVVSGTESNDSYEDAEPTEETEPTEQTQAEEETLEEQEGMTLEEAAADGYMVLPEGAQAEDAAAAEEMAAFSGKTTGKQANRTTTFTGLMPGQPYQIVVTKLTGAPVGDPEEDPAVLSQMVDEENLVYTNQKVAGSSGSLSFTYEVTTHEDVLVQLYGLANKRGIHLYAADGSDLDQTMGENGTVANLTLKLGEETASYQLRAEVTPVQWAGNLKWSVTPEGILDVDEDGVLTPLTAGTAYVKATVKHGTYEFSATCRVLVVNEKAQELSDVTLISTNAALELYKTSGFQLRIHPQLGNKASTYAYDADEDDETVETVEALGHLIQSAEFGSKDKNDDIVPNDDMNDLFDLEVMDDWSLWLIPTDYARENPDKVKSSYKSKIVLHTADQELLTEETLNISVKKNLPKLTASQLTINGFYNEKTYMPDIKGATVTGIYMEEDHANSWPEWLSIDEGPDGQLYVNPDITTKTANAKVWLSVETEQWAIPAAVQLPVKLIYQAPAVKLASSGITISQSDSYGVKDKLISQDKSLDLKALGVTDARVEDDRLTAEYDKENYQLTFYPNSDSYKGTFKTNVYVEIEGSSRELVLPLTVNMRAPEMRVSRTNVTLNTLYGDNADLDIHMTPADAAVPELEEENPLVITCRKGSKYVEVDGELEVTYAPEKKTVSISTNASTEPGANYRVTLNPVGQKPVVIAVKTLAKNTKPTVTLKVTGSLDLTYYKKGIKLTETFRNMFGDVDIIEYKVRKNNAAPVDFFDYFQAKNDDGEYLLKEDADLKAGDKLTILVYAKNDEDVVACSGSANLTVKRTAVNIRLSKSTLTLNKDAAQILKISYTVSPSGDNVKKADKPITKVSVEGAVNVEVDPDNQTILVSAGEDAVYGKTYKVFVKASEADRAATLNVQIANKTNSRIRLSASTSGTIDPTRDSTKVYVKYRASNFNFVDAVDDNGDPVYPKVTVWAFSNDLNDWVDVSEKFEIRPSTSRASTYSILKLPEAVLNSELKYQVRVTLKDAEGLDVPPAKAVLKVRAGSCSVKPDRTVTIYRSDLKAGHKFRLTSTDKNLNSVEKVTIVDKTLATMYNIEALGDGWFELRPSGANDAKIKTTSIKLNVFVRGMAIRTNAKGEPLPNGTVTLKLTVK